MAKRSPKEVTRREIGSLEKRIERAEKKIQDLREFRKVLESIGDD